MNARAKFLEVFSKASTQLSVVEREYFLGEISALSDTALASWIDSIDESAYPLVEWLQALLYFQSWVTQKGKIKTFPDRIEYLSCCIQGSASTGKLLALNDLLKDYLETYGVQ